jgi:hypothetical protein
MRRLILVFLVAPALAISFVEGFRAGQSKRCTQSASKRRSAIFATRSFDGSSSFQNKTIIPNRPSTSTVYINDNYVPPMTFVPVRTISSSKEASSSTLETTKKVAAPNSLRGGHYFTEMGHSVRQAAQDSFLPEESRVLLREAGDALHDIGTAWQENDWEAVTYCAFDASQSMKLVAQSLNRLHKRDDTPHENNKLQQAFAGVAVELKQLSKRKGQPKSVDLAGLSLRLHQAGRNSMKDETKRQLEQASTAARSLAKLYGASMPIFLPPRRWQQWWHFRRQGEQYNRANNHRESKD